MSSDYIPGSDDITSTTNDIPGADDTSCSTTDIQRDSVRSFK